MTNNQEQGEDILLEWIKSKKRQASNIAFTDGNDRRIAFEFEGLVKEISKLKEVINNLTEFSALQTEEVYKLKQSHEDYKKKVKDKMYKIFGRTITKDELFRELEELDKEE